MSCTHDCGCSAETRDARTDDWGHTSPLSPQNADLREFQPAEPSQPLGFIKERLADPYRCSGGPQDRVFLDYLLALVESLTAERDALRARLAAMEALADRWQKYAATLDPMSVESAASIAAIATMKGAYEGCAEKIRAALATTGEGQ